MRPAFRHALALTLLGCMAGACDHWPGVDDNAPVSGFPVGSSDGTCSGTPLPCGALGGEDCGNTAGCSDHGSCAGTATNVGQSCLAAFSFQSCAAIAGCFWTPSCVGTPLGSCSGGTEATCPKGCVFTPTTTNTGTGGSNGTGGSSGICTSFGQNCSSAGNCDCGFSCVQSCPTCRATCGNPCISDGDCFGATGSFGTVTPFCVGVPSPPTAQFTGICQSSR